MHVSLLLLLLPALFPALATALDPTCLSCPIHESPFMDVDGEVVCMCDETFAKVLTSDSTFDCACPPGTHLSHGRCVECPPGSYKPLLDLGSCSECADAAKTERNDGFVAGADKTNPPAISAHNCTCGKHEFRTGSFTADGRFEGQCTRCPTGSSCSTPGFTSETLPVLSGYWRSSPHSAIVTPCVNPRSCLQDSTCAEGHTGPLCNVCLPNYEKDVLNFCTQCDQSNAQTAKVVLAGFLWGTLVIFLLATFWSCVRPRKSLSVDTEQEELRLARLRENKGLLKKAITKFKILVSFFHIIGPLESSLKVRFPVIFSQFLRFMYALSSFDTLSVTSLSCIYDLSFYSRLVVATVGPVIATAMICVVGFVFHKNVRVEKKSTVVYICSSALLCGSYMCLTRTAVTIFQTFNCQAYGDDPTLYLVVDQSLECGTADHVWYQRYAMAMIFFYPLGIPTAYYLLPSFSKFDILNDKMKDSKLAFILDMYEPRYWWFDSFDAVRRLCLTAGLVIFQPVFVGRASLTNFAIALSFGSVVTFVHYKPFRKDENDGLAWGCQVSVFFTLLGALLIKLDVDTNDEYDQTFFAWVFIAVNTWGIATVAMDMVLGKPIKRLIDRLSKKHIHNGALREAPHKALSIEQFQDYNMLVAKSTVEEAGWESLNYKDWNSAFGLNSEKAEEWVKDTGAVAEWRCAGGNGPVDQCRVQFVVDANIEEIAAYLYAPETGVAAFYVLSSHDGRRVIYRAIDMPSVMSSRDFLCEEFIKRIGDLGHADYEVLICCRSFDDEAVCSVKESHGRGRVRGVIKDGGYLLQKFNGNEHQTKITRWVNCCLGGWFGLDWVHRKVAPVNMRESVDTYRSFSEWNQLNPGKCVEGNFPTANDFRQLSVSKRHNTIISALSDKEFEKRVSQRNKEKKEIERAASVGGGAGRGGMVMEHGHSVVGLGNVYASDKQRGNYDSSDDEENGGGGGMSGGGMMGGFGVPPPPDADDLGMGGMGGEGLEMNPMFVNKRRAESIASNIRKSR